MHQYSYTQCNSSDPNAALRLRLPGMFHNLTDHLAILDETPYLLGHRVFHIVVLGWEVDIDTAALARKHLSVQTILAQKHCRAINLI
jgi:hypothetical protein